MLQPATRRRLRAIPYPSVNPPTTPPPFTAPPPPPPPSLLLRWDAERESRRPQEHSPDDPRLLPTSRQPLPHTRGVCVEGYATAVPSTSHFRAEQSSPWTGSTHTTAIPTSLRHASSATSPPDVTPFRINQTSSATTYAIPSSNPVTVGPHLSHYPLSYPSRNSIYRQPIPNKPSNPSVSIQDDALDCHRDPTESDSTRHPKRPSNQKNGLSDEGSSRSRGVRVSTNAERRCGDRDSRRAETSSKFRGGQHGLLASFLFALVAASSMWRYCAALCPPRCQCDDLTLAATCSDAALEFVPIQLNPEVESISLHGNRISSVDQSLSFYARLRHLDLSSNRLRSLGERNFQLQGSLAALNVSGNHIGVVSRHALAGIGLSESLRVLDMARNRLGSFPLAAIAGLRSLHELYLAHNQLTSVGDGDAGGKIHLHSLELLDLTGNRLQEVPTSFLSHLPVLRVLILARNELSGLPDGSLPSSGLNTLSFAGNVNLGSSGIEDMAFSSTSKTLLNLDLSDSGLTSVPSKALSVLSSALSDLELSGNPIGELPEGAFSPLRSLKRVHLSRLSLLSTIHPAAFAGPNLPTSSSSSPQAVTAMCPPQLEHISMEWNPNLHRLPEGLFASCIRLTTLTLRGAALEGLDAAVLPAPPVRLRSLSLAGNPLRCNCSLMWLSALANASVGSQPFLDGARCAEPPRLAGRLLSRLAEAELRCEPSWETVLAIAMASVTFLLLTVFAILFGRRCARHYKCCGSLDTPTPTPTAPPPPPPRRHFPSLHSTQQNGVSHRKDMEFGVWGGKGPLGGGRDDSIAANEYTDLIGVGVGRMVIPAGYRGPTGVYV